MKMFQIILMVTLFVTLLALMLNHAHRAYYRARRAHRMANRNLTFKRFLPEWFRETARALVLIPLRLVVATINWCRYRDARVFANIAQGLHEWGKLTLTADAATSFRYALVKSGATPGVSFAQSAAATDVILGVCNDEPATGDQVEVQVLGAGGITMFVRLSGTVAFLDPLCSNGDGGAIKATSGQNQYVIGVALQAGVAGDTIEFDPIRSYAVF